MSYSTEQFNSDLNKLRELIRKCEELEEKKEEAHLKHFSRPPHFMKYFLNLTERGAKAIFFEGKKGGRLKCYICISIHLKNT